MTNGSRRMAMVDSYFSATRAQRRKLLRHWGVTLSAIYKWRRTLTKHKPRAYRRKLQERRSWKFKNGARIDFGRDDGRRYIGREDAHVTALREGVASMLERLAAEVREGR